MTGLVTYLGQRLGAGVALDAGVSTCVYGAINPSPSFSDDNELLVYVGENSSADAKRVIEALTLELEANLEWLE